MRNLKIKKNPGIKDKDYSRREKSRDHGIFQNLEKSRVVEASDPARACLQLVLLPLRCPGTVLIT